MGQRMERISSQRRVALADMPSENDAAPVCLSCGQNRGLIRTISNLGILPEILVFQCPNCHCVRAVQPTGVRRSAYSGNAQYALEDFEIEPVPVRFVYPRYLRPLLSFCGYESS